ncbi:tyrosine-type recombinase/integrase [Sphingomonas echinoides]|uniref:tyrosine-type recombinase/integrase n=1 Tax=Sphingomonas echinoides TaxID=59803 RepID=UPI002413C697|nr:site-specific integrase [Sphingomonas echinoides]
MATGKITKRSVDAMAKSERTEFLWDDELSGFGLRMTSNNAKSYVYQYRMGGREAVKKRYTIGKHGSPWTPDLARAEAKRLALLVGQGIDPAGVDKERRRQAVDLAFASYVGLFVDGYLKSHWKDWQQGKSLLEREAVPVLLRTPLPLIKRSDVVAVLDRLTDRPAVAKLMHATLRKMLKWAVSRGDLERSPIEEMDAPTGPAARDRVLEDSELATIWRASLGMGYPFGPMYRLLIVTGQRREEIAGLDWRELNRDSETWTLPAARAKNGKAHIVPLNALAIAELDSLAVLLAPATANDGGEVAWPQRGLVFTTTGKTSVSGHSRGKSRLDRDVALLLKAEAEHDSTEYHPMPDWRIHDFRRTAATGFQRLGVRFEVTEAVLNHISGARSGVAGVYQRHDWKEEKRTALDVWGRHVSGLIVVADQSNVTQIKRRVAP